MADPPASREPSEPAAGVAAGGERAVGVGRDVRDSIVSTGDDNIAVQVSGHGHTVIVNPSRTASRRSGSAFPLNMASPPPDDFVPRPELFGLLREALLGAATTDGANVAITAALKGAGGYGKTTLAQALCHDPTVVAAFPGGILWTELGETPGDLTGRLMDLARALDPEVEAAHGQAHAARLLRERLESRRCLLVVDDVWSGAHAKPFLEGAPGTVRLLTTRESACLPATLPKENRIDVDAMAGEEGAALLTIGIDVPNSSLLDALAERLGCWPLLLRLVNAELRLWIDEGGLDLGQAIARVADELDRRGLVAFDATDEADRNRAAGRTLELSFARLGGDRGLFEDLAVFPEDADIPIATVAAFWQVDRGVAARKLRDLKARSLLLRLDGESCRLHDVVRWHLRERARDRLPGLHRRVVEAYGRIAPDPYLFAWGAHHLAEAGEAEAARLMDLIRQKSAHVVARHPDQCANQLIGRLRPGLDPALDRWRAAAHGAPSVLRLRSSSLIPADHPLRVTLEARAYWVYALAVLGDGRLASGSEDGTIRIWDMDGASAAVVLEGHADGVAALAVLGDGRLASGSRDGTIRIWDVNGADDPVVLEGHADGVAALAVLGDGRLASGSRDGAIRLWDVDGASAAVMLEGHAGWVNALAVLKDGRLASGSGDKTIRVWDVDGASNVVVPEGHADGIAALAVLGDGRLVSGSGDSTIRLWDGGTGACLGLVVADEAVMCLAVLPDGGLAAGDWSGRIHFLDVAPPS